MPFDYYSVDYQMVDALARHFAGAPVQLTAPPLWLVTKANLPTAHSALFPDVTNYQSQFLKLWGKSLIDAHDRLPCHTGAGPATAPARGAIDAR